MGIAEYTFPNPVPWGYQAVPIPKGYIASTLPRDCCLDFAARAPEHVRRAAIDRAIERAKKDFPHLFKQEY